MGMAVVGAYLRVLRDEGRKISRAKLASELAVSEQSIYRIEENRQEPGPELLASLTEAVRGSPEDVHRLLLDKHATIEDAKNLALKRLSMPAPVPFEAEVQTLLSQHDPKVVRQIAEELLLEYEQSPSVLDGLKTWLAGWRAGKHAAND